MTRRFPQPSGAARFRRSPCNIAVLTALALMAAAHSASAAPAGTILPGNTIPVLRGLVSDYRNSATFTTAPIAGGAGQSLTINQLQPKIILNWNQFNIGNGSKVEFIQPSATAAVLNRIFDADPSIIQGQIKANGQVFLINQNGILFDRGTQIDVNTLVASSMNISNDRFNGALAELGVPTTPAFTGGYDANGATIAGAKTGKIVIGANGSALAAAPKINAAAGGAVVVIAPLIDNQSGVITSPDGQVVLAAGRSVYLSYSNTNNSSLRGMLVEVSAGTEPVDLSSVIRNSGSVSADRGNVTLAALAINQSGRVSATSATLANGSIYLQARDNGNTRRGTVTLAAGSLTETPLDSTDKTTLREADSFAAFRPVVNIQAASIIDDGRIASPSGSVTLDAKDTSNPANARIYLGAGSSIDASGAWSDASSASNLLTFKVTSNELKDSPDQKNGILHGQVVTVDLRAGSSLLDLSGYQQNQARSLAQKAATGGEVTLNTTGDLIQRTGSTVDVSGGGVRYQGGVEATTRLIGSDGKVYDIATAPEALTYVAVADKFTQSSPRWGYSQSFGNALGGAVQPDYVQGAAGGSLQISMGAGLNGLVLDGALRGGVTVGARQLAAAPRGATLSIGSFDPIKTSQDFGVGDVRFAHGVLSSLPADFGADSALDADRKAELVLATDVFSAGVADANNNLVSTGFGTLNLNANGRIDVPVGVSVQGPVGGELNLRANQIDVEGRIVVPAGTVNATGVLTSASGAAAVAQGISVASGALIDTSGVWTNNYLTQAASAVPAAVLSSSGVAVSTSSGGAISLTGRLVDLNSGSALDVSAGGVVSAKAALSGGAAGSISLSADSTQVASPLALDGQLLGFGFSAGGSLSLSTVSAVTIGGAADAAGLNFDAGFFNRGGFQKFKIAATQDLSVAAGVALRPQQINLQLDGLQAAALPSGADPLSVAARVVLPDNLRKPASLALSSASHLSLDTGSSITTDVGGSVSLAGALGVAIDGQITTPGGTISVAVAAPDQIAPPSLHLGAQGSLIARGAFTAQPNDRQLVQGTLVSGGSVSLSAKKATISLDEGSVIDVSGAAQAVDLPTAAGSRSPYERVTQVSNAGTVSISGNDAMSLAGTITGHAGGPTAAGGSFALSLTTRGDYADTTSSRRIVVTQAGTPVDALAGYTDAAVSATRLASGGFDKLRLQSEDQIVFATDANVVAARGITLDSKVIEVADNASVELSGASVKLANSFGQRLRSNPGDPTDPRTVNDASLASLPQATRAGTGSLAVNAGTIDIVGSVTISGAQRESLVAHDDLRLSGRLVGNAGTPAGAKLTGSLTSAGDLALSAAQIYPTTGSAFKIAVADGVSGTPVANGRIDISGNSNARGDVYSAGGSLTLAADTIVQGGVLKAPIGLLELDAGQSLVLGRGSITSVSADGLVIPYGETQAGVTWTYGATGSNPLTNALNTPPAKRIALNSPSVNVQSGATVDVSGGGDLAAFEFIPGSTGSKDALIQPNTYAIVPASKLSSMPVDADIALLQNLGFGADSAVYNSVRIGPGGPVAAGDYVLLPGYYALLKGGYMVQLINGSTYANLLPGQTATLANGLTVVPGQMTAAGTDVVSAKTIGVVVRPNTDIATLAGYTTTNAAYFATLADKNRAAVPFLPVDGGQLSITATQNLALNGNLLAKLPTAAARSAEVDLAASKIALVDQVGRVDIAPDYLQIDAASLSRLDASILIGGVRSTSAAGLLVTPTATDIVVANSDATSLKAPELILAATDAISVRAGSRIEGGGTRVAPGADLSVADVGSNSGALIRVANSALVNVNRAHTDSTRGSVNVEAGATIASSGSVTLDATRTTTSAGALQVASGGGLSLVSGSVSLGDLAGVTGLDSGLALDNTQLAGFNQLGTLSLKSYSGIDLYGAAQVGSAGLKNLVLDAASITGRASGSGALPSAQLAATQVTLLNTGTAPGSSVAADALAGSLVVRSAQVVVGAGDKRISGYNDLQLDASAEILGAGTGTLQTASTMHLSAARIASTSGADQTWTALDGSAADPAAYRAITVHSVTPAKPLADSTALGSRLKLAGSSIDDSGNILMKSGGVTLQAMGQGSGDGITLGAGAVIDAGGLTKDFKGTLAVADAGRIRLEAEHGTVQLAAGSTISVAAADQGGNAGSLAIVAEGAVLGGTLKGGAARGTQGSYAMDVASLGDFSALNTQLNGAGFTESRDIRVRTGDVTVAAADVVHAHRLVLAADTGAVDVQGRLDASATLGKGSVEVYGNTVRLEAGAVVDASATSDKVDVQGGTSTAPYANGGTVALVSQGGSLDFENGAVIDVRAGAKGAAGEVLLRAPRSGSSVQATLTGQVLSQRQPGAARAAVAVEGNRIYNEAATGSVITPDMIDAYAADNVAFMGAVNASALAAGIRGDDGAAQGNVHVRPAVEVRAAGDLSVASNWDLTGAGWRMAPNGSAMVEAGSLTVRAGGNLTLDSASIGNPDNALQRGATWNVALASGADLAAANPMRSLGESRLAAQAVSGVAGAGDLVLDSQLAEASVRTGTGNIRLSAGRDFVIKAGTDQDTGGPLVGVVYSAGQAAIVDPRVSAANARFTQDGGDISISAQRDAVGAGDEWMTEWFRYSTATDGSFSRGVWWSYRPNFHDGVATLGGGDVAIAAGRDIRNLSAWAPTSAIKVVSGDSAALQVFGGGDIALKAGGDVVGGQYLVSRGRGAITAGGSVGSSGQKSQLFMMGASGDEALAQSAVQVTAGQSITLATIDSPASLFQSAPFGNQPSFNPNNRRPVLGYSANSVVGLTAMGGNVTLGNRPLAKATLDVGDQPALDDFVTDPRLPALLPASVSVAALGADVVFNGLSAGGILFPSLTGGLKVLSGKGISGLNMTVSDADASLFAIRNVSQTDSQVIPDLLMTSVATPNRLIANNSTDRFVNDIVAMGGSITGASLTLPTRSRVWSAGDILNPVFNLQNLGLSDQSQVIADQGSVSGPNTAISIGGPGSLLIEAGQNVSLGTAMPLASYGNQKNLSLPSAYADPNKSGSTLPGGAEITVIAGVSGAVDLTQLGATFDALTLAGKNHDATAAQDAVDKFFANAKIHSGSIDSYNTSIQSFAGSSIDLLAPGGNITVGLTTPNKDKLIGLVTNAGGAIRSYLSGDFDINQGKVLTAQGGDILIYTADGSIDAGRGAKTSVTTPPPSRKPVFDSNGNLVGFQYTLPVAVAGSGIQTVTSKPNGPTSVAPPSGNIYLFAPSGTIDAGEAGIASGGNIFIAALTVLNADNISSAGTATGVPPTVAGSLASSMASSGATTAAGASKDSDSAAQAAAAAAQAAAAGAFKPAILTVEVLGFGDKNCKETAKDCLGK